MPASHGRAIGELAQHAFATAGALHLLLEHMEALGWRTDDFSREDLALVAASLRGMSVRAAMSSGEATILNMITGQVAVPDAPPAEPAKPAATPAGLTGPAGRARLAAELHAYADEVAAGHTPTPALSWTDSDHSGLKVVPRVLHDVLCAWRVASGQDTEPEVLACAGCGLAYPKSS